MKKRKIETCFKLDRNCNQYKNLVCYLGSLLDNKKYLITDTANEIGYRYTLALFQSETLEFHDTKIRIEHKEISPYKTSTYRFSPVVQRELSFYLACENPKEVIDLLIKEASEFCEEEKEEKFINIYHYDSKSKFWNFTCKKEKRKLETLFLKENVLENIIKDLEKFYKNKELYQKFGIPYKRNYLFEGVPGTGKTSLITILASHFELDVYIITFNPSMTDDNLNTAINAYMRKSKNEKNIVVIEDIDSLFIDRESCGDNKSNMSFSGLLNCLDGISVRDAQVIAITTNYKNRLDPALLRPGRIDYHINFDFMDKYQIKKMYNYYFDEGFKKFYKRVEYKRLTPAILQRFFFDNLEHDIFEKMKELDELINFTKKECRLDMYT